MIVSVILITMLPGLRIDLTEDRLYTLSEERGILLAIWRRRLNCVSFTPKAPQKISLRSALMAAGFRNYWKKSPLPARQAHFERHRSGNLFQKRKIWRLSLAFERFR